MPRLDKASLVMVTSSRLVRASSCKKDSGQSILSSIADEIFDSILGVDNVGEITGEAVPGEAVPGEAVGAEVSGAATGEAVGSTVTSVFEVGPTVMGDTEGLIVESTQSPIGMASVTEIRLYLSQKKK